MTQDAVIASDDGLHAVHIGRTAENFCSNADWVSTNADSQLPPKGHFVRRLPTTAHRVVELVETIHLPMLKAIVEKRARQGK